MKTNASHKRSMKVISNHNFVQVMENPSTGQKSLHATTHYQPGDVICSFSAGETLRKPTYLTIQTGRRRHITLVPEFLQYTNHSCDPTVFFDTARMEFICLSSLQPGDELTFFYPSTEWDMAQPFTCNCGSKDCLQVIRGAAHLSAEVLEKYELTKFIKREMKKQVMVVS